MKLFFYTQFWGDLNGLAAGISRDFQIGRPVGLDRYVSQVCGALLHVACRCQVGQLSFQVLDILFDVLNFILGQLDLAAVGGRLSGHIKVHTGHHC